MSYQRACATADLAEGTPLGLDLDGTRVALIRSGDRVHAIHDECSHARILLSVGDFDPDDLTLECYGHGARFDLATGEPLDLPATLPVPIYDVTIDGDDILVDLDNPINPRKES